MKFEFTDKSNVGKDQKVAILAIGINLVIFAIKYTFAGYSGSIALKAGAFDSLTDIVASCTVFAGLVIARRKTKSFPYGLYKVENLVSIIIALVILYVGYEIVMEAMQREAVIIRNVWPTGASILVIIAIAYGFSRYEARVGKAIDSPSLMADAKHIRADMFANAVVLAGLCSNFAGVNLDRIAAFIIVGFIAVTGVRIFIDGIRVLLDASLDYKTLSLAEKLILAEPQVVEIIDLTGRNSGRYKFIEASILLKTHTLDKAKYITDQIETHIKQKIKNVDRVLIHYEPAKKEYFKYALPLEDVQKQLISDHFGQAPYFSIVKVRVKGKKVVEQKVFDNPFTQIDHGKGIMVAELLNKHSIDVIITKEDFEGKGPSYVFSNAAVDNLMAEENTVNEVLKRLGIRYESDDLEIPLNSSAVAKSRVLTGP